ncbi:MAG TPA: hypothetical protein VJR05_04645 [Acidimicrobiia bacterium]|nr:hypothetical protein [Acidimicrobiia bacterium]
MKRIVMAIPAAILVACTGTGGTTEGVDPGATIQPAPTTEAPAADSPTAAAITQLRADLAEFSAEVQAAASVELAQAWADLDSELAALATSVEDGDISDVDLTPAQEALAEVTAAVQADQDQLSAEFQEFWTEFTTRFSAVVTS